MNRIARARPEQTGPARPPYLNERRTSGQPSIGRVSGARDGAKANRFEDELVA